MLEDFLEIWQWLGIGLRPYKKWSGKPGSNWRPQPWQGCALPAELFPLMTVNTAFLALD